jgi:hypothetical protein
MLEQLVKIKEGAMILLLSFTTMHSNLKTQQIRLKERRLIASNAHRLDLVQFL